MSLFWTDFAKRYFKDLGKILGRCFDFVDFSVLMSNANDALESDLLSLSKEWLPRVRASGSWEDFERDLYDPKVFDLYDHLMNDFGSRSLWKSFPPLCDWIQDSISLKGEEIALYDLHRTYYLEALKFLSTGGEKIRKQSPPVSGTEIIFSRCWSMPNANTFSIKPIAALLEKYVSGVVIDPFSRNSTWGTLTNDLDPESKAQYHLSATEFLDMLLEEKGEEVADVVLLDPPYSPRQISECYKGIGKKVTGKDTQNARLYKACKDRLTRLLKPGGLAITCGWNSNGFGKTRKFQIIEILLVAHGSAHNDTIVVVEKKK